MLKLLTLLAFALGSAQGHGYLTEPPGRVSMWRFGFKTPVSYDDSQFFCGGFSVQWEKYGGKCGPCGDSFGLLRPRPAENGGKYGLGIVTRTFKSGQEISATVQLTANHLGYFTFSICPLSSPGALEEDACFDKYILQLADGSGTKYKIGSDTGSYTVKLRLPAGLKCLRCVLRWHYNTGNSWGTCPDGKGAMGCGAQENFRSCSDITIA